MQSGRWTKGVAAMTTADQIANGLGLIIDEHDAQYCLVAAAQKAFVNELDPAITAGLLSMLLQCTETHAMSEERLMQLCDFPEYAHHVGKHNQLVEKVQTILCTYRSGQRRQVVDQLDAFADALNGHIGEDDAALQRHLLRFCPGRSAH